jgi:hypothetical protein
MAQAQLNDYKYIIVPKQFEEFKRKNQYQTSTLVKHLFTEKGFEAVYEDELPEELNNNRCLGLRAKLVDGSSLFTTKASVILENCNGQQVFTTKEGKSKEKDYKDSYGEALREAFTSFDTTEYSYNGKAENSGSVTVNMENDVKKMDEEKRKERTSVNRPDVMVEQEATLENQRYVDRRPQPSNLKKSQANNGMVEQEATQENQRYEDKRPTESNLGSAVKKSGSATQAASPGQESYKDGDPAASDMEQGDGADLSDIASATLYAQELPNGYQLADSTPKIRLKIHKTSMPDFYLAEAGGTNGVVFEKNGTWFFEYYSGDNLMTEELDVKF